EAAKHAEQNYSERRRISCDLRALRVSGQPSHAEQVLFLVGQVLADVLDRLVRGSLDVLFEALRLILGRLGLLDGLKGVAAEIADMHAAVLGKLVARLNELEAPLAAHLGKGNADEFTVHDGIEAEVGLLDGLANGL